MITYKWNIESLECYPSEKGQTNVVSQVFYSVSGTDGVSTGNVTGNITVNSEDAFIPFANLTEDILINWVQTSLGSQVSMVEGVIDSQIAPVTVTPKLPWL